MTATAFFKIERNLVAYAQVFDETGFVGYDPMLDYVETEVQLSVCGYARISICFFVLVRACASTDMPRLMLDVGGRRWSWTEWRKFS